MTTEELVDAARSHSWTPPRLRSLEEAVTQGRGPAIIARMVATHRSLGLDEYGSVRRTMADLEAIADHSPDAATGLMTHLRPLASGAHAADVYDAIDLWLHDNRGSGRP